MRRIPLPVCSLIVLAVTPLAAAALIAIYIRAAVKQHSPHPTLAALTSPTQAT